MGEHGALEVTELRPGLQSELLDQHRPRIAVRPQRIGLTAAAIQGPDQLAVKLLPQRVLPYQLGQRHDEVGVPPRCQLGLGPSLVCSEEQLLEPRRGLATERVVDQIAERWTANQADGGVETL